MECKLSCGLVQQTGNFLHTSVVGKDGRNCCSREAHKLVGDAIQYHEWNTRRVNRFRRVVFRAGSLR